MYIYIFIAQNKGKEILNSDWSRVWILPKVSDWSNMAPETKDKNESEDLFENSDIVIACTVMSDRPKGIM